MWDSKPGLSSTQADVLNHNASWTCKGTGLGGPVESGVQFLDTEQRKVRLTHQAKITVQTTVFV